MQTAGLGPFFGHFTNGIVLRSNGPQTGNDVKVPGEIDAQRAREILESIRRRLGENFRPQLELDYLDRLLPSR